MKKTADTFYMTQKQQQAFRKKLRGKKKIHFGRFFLLAGILVAAIARCGWSLLWTDRYW